MPLVSLFPFPSNGKAHGHYGPGETTDDLRVFVFPFPSNGKAHGHGVCRGKEFKKRDSVSIPFKRESPWALFDQSPPKRREKVSIPFKRESPWALTLFSTHATLDPKTPNPNTNCAGLFWTQKLERKSPKPLSILTQTRFFRKNTAESRHRIGL